jgi:hypothetical protein
LEIIQSRCGRLFHSEKILKAESNEIKPTSFFL